LRVYINIFSVDDYVPFKRSGGKNYQEIGMSEISIKNVDESEIDTILSEDIDFTGELTFNKPLMIKGKFNGEIKASSDLYIGKEAVLTALVEADLVSVKGTVDGNIKSRKRVELFSSSVIEGDITSPSVVMENGCNFNGICKMEKQR
jgi:cytoskeletal protein CcmA (bactofilin family)